MQAQCSNITRDLGLDPNCRDPSTHRPLIHRHAPTEHPTKGGVDRNHEVRGCTGADVAGSVAILGRDLSLLHPPSFFRRSQMSEKRKLGQQLLRATEVEAGAGTRHKQ